MADVPSATPTEQIAGFEIRRELAAAGGRTYLAEGDGRRVVVLKALEEDCLLDGKLHPLIHDRLSRVRELAHLGVANLIGVHSDGRGRAYLVWEYIEGTPIADLSKSAELDRRRSWARELILAVETLHVLGIVHGEIHGNNVIVTPSGRVRLTHVSPLLHNESRVDVEAVARLLRDMGFGLDGGSSLRALLQVIDERDGEGKSNASLPTSAAAAAAHARYGRRGSLIAAAVVALAGAAIAVGVWYWTRALAENELPAAPTHAIAPRGEAS